MSPWLFARYITDLLTKVVTSKVGCNVGGVFIFAYADDIVLLAQSWCGLQYLLDVVVELSKSIDMSLNGRKNLFAWCLILEIDPKLFYLLFHLFVLGFGTEMQQYVPVVKLLSKRWWITGRRQGVRWVRTLQISKM